MNDLTTAELIHQALGDEKAGRSQEARDKLQRVLAHPDSSETLEAKLQLGRLLIYSGTEHFDQAEEVLTSARGQAEKIPSPRQVAQAIHFLALLAWRRRRYEQAEELLQQSPAMSLDETPGPERAQYLHYRGLLARAHNQLSQAERFFHRAYQVYEEVGYDEGLSQVCQSLAGVLLVQGKTAGALQFAERSLELKRRWGDRLGEVITLITVGKIYTQQARFDQARQAFDQCMALAGRMDYNWDRGVHLIALAELGLRQGQGAVAADLFRQVCETDKNPATVVHALLGLARVHLASGEQDAATAVCERAAVQLKAVREPGGLPDLLTGVQGMLAWRRGDASQGERLLVEAIQKLQQHSYGLETIPLLYELRDLYAASPKKEERTKAVVVMSQALSLFTELGADRAIEEVEAWIRSVDSPALTRLILERQFPEHLVQQILDGKLKRPESSQQKVTVLFSDIRGYTRLSEDLKPKEVVDLLNDWFSEATRAIRRHGGVIDKFIGDAVMAVFGVPEAHAEDAARAVRAALDMREALFSLNLRHKALGRKTLRIGIGIHTGEAVLGYIGSHLHQSYTVIGDAINVASRLESATKDYDSCDILISHETQREQDRFDVAVTRPLGLKNLHNRDQPVALYQVLGPRKAVAGTGD